MSMSNLANGSSGKNGETDGGWVKLISKDGFEFVIPKEVAMGSGNIKTALSDDSGFNESKEGIIRIDHRGIIVDRIVQYLSYKFQYKDVPTKDITEDFSERIEPELALELLMAADFMDT